MSHQRKNSGRLKRLRKLGVRIDGHNQVAHRFAVVNNIALDAVDPQTLLVKVSSYAQRVLLGEAPRRCRNCHCTDDKACPEGCHWTSADVCSACTPNTAPQRHRLVGLGL